MSSYDLASLGWDDFFSASFGNHADGDSAAQPGRVTRVDRARVTVLTADGPEHAVLSPTLLAAAAEDPTGQPCTGDWVVVRRWPDGRVSAEAVLPRRTVFLRASGNSRLSKGQVLAANIDTVMVTEGLQPEPDLGRIERLLALAWQNGAEPVIVLTKADLAGDAEMLVSDVAAAAPGAAVYAVSAVTGEGMDALAPYLAPGRTVALLGPSGAGKSTLTNALAAVDVMVTRAPRADHKGRHTTVHRELVVLPGGGMVIDTPGLRSIGLWDANEGLDRVFTDIDELAAQCRFADCGHRSEPGCAVLAAVDAGELAERRLTSWHKLQREMIWIASRTDARLRAEQAQKWIRISRESRRSGRIRP
ncbi:MAG: ribosome small subunit-dependent GTPase A [Sporichthyaceae bacterium]|nr:ribosome small subunit-dependent GTPase A [Sporichthyaceae bacterium]